MTVAGRFITFEGIDGAGKSTQHQWLIERLRQQGREVVATREPGGTPLGEKLRELLLSDTMELDTEALLMFAARREHVQHVIQPALDRGAWVICDRFTDATIAYQGGGRGLSIDRIAALIHWTLGSLRPDLTFLFDIPVETAMMRVRNGSASPDRFEREQSEFFERVRGKYLEIAVAEPVRVKVIDARKSVFDIQAELEKIIASH
jgi:dTMP kinase